MSNHGGRPSDNVFHENIILTFPKPLKTHKAKLIVNAATGLWGSYMIREMLALRGSELASWYKRVDLDPMEAKRIHEWSFQTEKYALKIKKETGSGWALAGVLLGEGPFITEDRVVDLDLSDVSGEVLKLKIQPPRGFWALNSFSIDYNPDEPIETTFVYPTQARGHDGTDLLDPILSVDNQYYQMPEIGNFAIVHFPEPLENTGFERTVFLKSRGYYLLHFKGSGVPDLEKLSKLEEDSSYILHLAAQRYHSWNPELGTSEGPDH